MEEESNYINWVFNLEGILKKFNIDISDYDEFHVGVAIKETEKIIAELHISKSNHLTEDMIDDYMKNAIKNNPLKKEYYETISSYVKKRLIQR